MNYYDENVVDYIDSSIVKNPFFQEWYNIVSKILLNDEFQKRKLFMHHYNITVWEHSILVSFEAFLMGKRYKADERVCAIAGLLHDFYSQAWISTEELESLENGKYTKLMKEKKPLFQRHGFTHAKDASINYIKFFPELEDEKITNCILRHMFPLNIIPPKYREGIIITIVDKRNSLKELPSISQMLHKTIKYIINLLKSKTRY